MVKLKSDMFILKLIFFENWSKSRVLFDGNAISDVELVEELNFKGHFLSLFKLFGNFGINCQISRQSQQHQQSINICASKNE
ncbi:hypothetical protein T03_14987 [Trichinella britovi]|uniref:Uncharacterized protein n=1 Tax=Trichinella britovi TaxID=45882 RepID=A0A0V1D6F5_TRIBR|nr:hypothetical protein T03_14987 [Trichinella britovi]